MPNIERTGWRDILISERHRHWGKPLCFVNIDSFWIEYQVEFDKEGNKQVISVALVEHKQELASPQYIWNDSNWLALIDLARRANLPAFAMRYSDDFEKIKLRPLNLLAAQAMKTEINIDWNYSEYSYVELLYSLRKLSIPTTVAEWIDNQH